MEQSARLWNKNFIILFLMKAASGMATMMVVPLIAKYVVSIGGTLEMAALVATLMSWAALAVRPLSGPLSDRLNRKTILLVSMVVIAGCCVAYCFTKNMAVIIVLRIIHGIAFAFFGVSSLAFSAMFVPRDKMGEGLGYISMGDLVASAVGPGLGISLLGKFDFNTVYLLAAGILGVSSALLLMIPYVKPQQGPEMKAFSLRETFALKNLIAKEAIIFACMMGLFSAGNSLMSTYSAIIGEERNIPNISVFYTAYAVAALIVRPFSGKLLDKRGLTLIVIPAYFIAAASNFVIGIAMTGGLFALAGVLKAVGQGTGSPSIQAECVRRVGQEKAGVIGSTCYIGQDIGNALTPILAAPIVNSFGYGTLFKGFSILLVTVGLGLYALELFLEKRRAEKKAAAAAEE